MLPSCIYSMSRDVILRLFSIVLRRWKMEKQSHLLISFVIDYVLESHKCCRFGEVLWQFCDNMLLCFIAQHMGPDRKKRRWARKSIDHSVILTDESIWLNMTLSVVLFFLFASLYSYIDAFTVISIHSVMIHTLLIISNDYNKLFPLVP